jgi:transposase
MEPAPKNKLPSEAEMASYGPAQFIALVQTLGSTIQSLQHQLEWFQRQMFGTKSERLRVLENAQQLALGEILAPRGGSCAP